MPTLIYPNTGAKLLATAAQTLFQACEVRLFKQGEVVVSPTTTLADLDDAECDFSGYTAGGITVEDFLDPILAPEGGYAIQSPIVQFSTANPTTVGNLVGGWYVVTDTGALGVACQLDSAVPMQVPGQGMPVDIRLVFRNG